MEFLLFVAAVIFIWWLFAQMSGKSTSNSTNTSGRANQTKRVWLSFDTIYCYRYLVKQYLMMATVAERREDEQKGSLAIA